MADYLAEAREIRDRMHKLQNGLKFSQDGSHAGYLGLTVSEMEQIHYYLTETVGLAQIALAPMLRHYHVRRDSAHDSR